MLHYACYLLLPIHISLVDFFLLEARSDMQLHMYFTQCNCYFFLQTSSFKLQKVAADSCQSEPKNINCHVQFPEKFINSLELHKFTFRKRKHLYSGMRCCAIFQFSNINITYIICVNDFDSKVFLF